MLSQFVGPTCQSVGINLYIVDKDSRSPAGFSSRLTPVLHDDGQAAV